MIEGNGDERAWSVIKVDYDVGMADMSAREVAARLGVKLETVYAYVSRGVLTTRGETGSRRSVFDSDEVEVLARRGRPRRSTRPAALDLIVETELTTVIDQRLRYRDRDVCTLAETRSFEQVADWLWRGSDESDGATWESYPLVLPELASVRDRLRVAVVLASEHEPFRSDLSVGNVVSTARSLIASMVDAVPAPTRAEAVSPILGGQAISASIASCLWARLSARAGTTRAGTTRAVAIMNATLVLLADHELATSTMAARIAASARSDVFSVVLAGMGPLAGPLHGSASGLVHQTLADAVSRGPQAAVATAVETHGRVPGFGHPFYPDGDPRAAFLLARLAEAFADAPEMHAANAVMGAVDLRSRVKPNIDFALGLLTLLARMPADAGETIFTIARTAGWVAHAIEEYKEPALRFRARAIPRHLPG
ncbi:citrate/2-methylcitrate synthase [Microbacterium sp.]|uniref:citrate/2-methylcitrate synthase n=1 Tax=Microbacterium sp. TaxID=51671 RepID=UPI003A860509